MSRLKVKNSINVRVKEGNCKFCSSERKKRSLEESFNLFSFPYDESKTACKFLMNTDLNGILYFYFTVKGSEENAQEWELFSSLTDFWLITLFQLLCMCELGRSKDAPKAWRHPKSEKLVENCREFSTSGKFQFIIRAEIFIKKILIIFFHFFSSIQTGKAHATAHRPRGKDQSSTIDENRAVWNAVK